MIIKKFNGFCRINFTLEHLAPASPAYDFFRQYLDMTYTAESTKIRFELQQLSMCDIQRFSDYERIQEFVSHAAVKKKNLYFVAHFCIMQEIWQLNPILICQ
jgi:hypothetical protein